MQLIVPIPQSRPNFRNYTTNPSNTIIHKCILQMVRLFVLYLQYTRTLIAGYNH